MRIRIDVDFDVRAGLRRASLVLLALSIGFGAHVVTAEPESFDESELLTSVKLNGNFTGLHTRVLALEAPPETPECPRGYVAAGVANPANAASLLCTKGVDEMVRVGTGHSAFWIDRYEVSLWDSATNPTMQYGGSSDNYPATFPDTGQWTTALHALSREGVPPSTRITWFQAHQACAIAGKQLPTHAEWLAAAFRTPDPGSNSGSTGACVTTGNVRNTGGGTTCRSWFGAEDMIGNAWEWGAEVNGASPQTSTFGSGTSPYPTTGITGSFAGDFTYSDAYAHTSSSNGYVFGLLGGAIYGGSATEGVGSGIFAAAYTDSVMTQQPRIGARCIIRQ